MDDVQAMAKIGCPFCTKTGVTMVITGLALVLLSAMIAVPWLAIIGLVILLAAYIVPNLVSGDSCHGESCSQPAQSPGEEASE